MIAAMNHPLRAVSITFLSLAAALPAQNEGEKPKPKEAPKAEAQSPQKDDAATTNDKAIVAIDAFIAKANVDKKADAWRTRLSAPPQQKFDDKSDYFWHVETSVGPLKIQYFPDTAPNHVTSGIYLARLGFYDGLKFHRIIKGFMAQGGCPLGTGTGGPGYKFGSEFTGGRKHDKPGILSMANAGEGTDGSQFFLTFVPTPHLDGRHTIWGIVVDGMDTVKALEATGTAGEGRPANAPSIVRSWVSVAPKKAADKPKDAEKKDGDKKEGDKGK
jgi:peptidyl-prolyl cis-trans isomerase B (cyclophilin B)